MDFGGAVFAPDTDELIATTYVGDRTRIYPREKRFRKAYDFLRKRFPDGDLGIASVTRDMRLHAGRRRTATSIPARSGCTIAPASS